MILISTASSSYANNFQRNQLFRARLGMESASQRILDDMIKNTTPENMEMSLYALSKHGILTSTLWIIAYPGETENEFNETLKFIKDSSAHIYQSDPWLFQYHPVGLSKSDKISSEKGSKARFSDYINEILSVSPYHVDQDLAHEERFGRLERFTCEMEKLGICISLREWNFVILLKTYIAFQVLFKVPLYGMNH